MTGKLGTLTVGNMQDWREEHWSIVWLKFSHEQLCKCISKWFILKTIKEDLGLIFFLQGAIPHSMLISQIPQKLGGRDNFSCCAWQVDLGIILKAASEDKWNLRSVLCGLSSVLIISSLLWMTEAGREEIPSPCCHLSLAHFI